MRVGRGLLASAILIGAITAAARAVGFGRWLVFSDNIGAQCVGVAYSTANLLPNVLFEVVAGGALAGAVVPLLAGPLARAVAAEVEAIASALLTWVLVLLVPAALLLAALAGPLSRLLLVEDCAGQEALVARLLLVFAPQIPLYGIGVVLTGVLIAHRRFLWPALAPLLSSLLVVGAYLRFGATADGAQNQAQQLPAVAEAWLAWGTTAGVAVMTLPLLVPIRRLGVRLRPTVRFPPGVARRGAALAGAGLGALLAQQASVLVVLVLANRASGEGALVVYQYVQAVYLLPYAVLAVPLATSAFPRLAEQAATGDRPGFARIAASSTRAVLLVALFGAAILIAVAAPVADFFARLDPGDVTAMAGALIAMAPGLVGFALIVHLGRALYALERAREAVLATATGWITVILGSVIAVQLLPVVLGLAVGNTVGMIVAAGLLVIALRRSAGPTALTGLGRTMITGLIAAVPAALAGRLVGLQVLDSAPIGIGGAILAGGAAGALGTALFALLLSLLDRQSLLAALSRLRRNHHAEVNR